MKKIYLFFGATFFIFFLYLILSVYLIEKRQFGYAEIWLENLYKVKDHINTLPTDKQRLLIFSGSNSLFGFNGAMVDSQTRFHFINYGTHGAIPLNFHVDKIINVTKENDIIFLPLEYTYYSNKEPRRSYWYIHNMLAWGNGYNKYIDKYSILLSYFKMPPQAALQKSLYALRLKEDQDSIESIKQIWKQPNIQDFSYNYKTLNQHGDFCTQQGEIKNINEGYLTKDMQVSTFSYKNTKDYKNSQKQKRLKFSLLTPLAPKIQVLV